MARASESKLLRDLEWAVLASALITIPLTVLQLRGEGGVAVVVLDWMVWSVFLVDFAARVHPRVRHGTGFRLKDPWAWVDLTVVVLSFPLLPAMFGLIRVARLARIVRIGRAAAVGARGLGGTFGRRRLLLMVMITGVAVVSVGAVMAKIEPQVVGGTDIWTGIWWAIVATIGVAVGEPGPVTSEGRILTMFLMVCGVGIIAALAAYMVESFIKTPPRPKDSRRTTQDPRIKGEFSKALSYAVDIHRNDVRGRKSVPIMGHLLAVTALVLEDGGSQEEAIAALLHDAPEGVAAREASGVYKGIQTGFGDVVVHMVELCASAPGNGTWREQRTAYLEGLRAQGRERFLRVPLAKELDNARAFRRDIELYGADAWVGDDPTGDDMRWYYEELATFAWPNIDSPMVEELANVLATINASPGARGS